MLSCILAKLCKYWVSSQFDYHSKNGLEFCRWLWPNFLSHFLENEKLGQNVTVMLNAIYFFQIKYPGECICTCGLGRWMFLVHFCHAAWADSCLDIACLPLVDSSDRLRTSYMSLVGCLLCVFSYFTSPTYRRSSAQHPSPILGTK